MSFGETIFLFVLALVVFGPKKLPEIARQVGKYLAEFRRASNEFKSQIEQEIAHIEVQERQKKLQSTATPEGTASRSLKPAVASEDAAKVEESPATLATSAESAPEASASSEASTPATEAVPASDVAAPASQESHA